jgi:hypothetical protein
MTLQMCNFPIRIQPLRTFGYDFLATWSCSFSYSFSLSIYCDKGTYMCVPLKQSNASRRAAVLSGSGYKIMRRFPHQFCCNLLSTDCCHITDRRYQYHAFCTISLCPASIPGRRWTDLHWYSRWGEISRSSYFFIFICPWIIM